jgi:hypothetical protein
VATDIAMMKQSEDMEAGRLSWPHRTRLQRLLEIICLAGKGGATKLAISEIRQATPRREETFSSSEELRAGSQSRGLGTLSHLYW